MLSAHAITWRHLDDGFRVERQHCAGECVVVYWLSALIARWYFSATVELHVIGREHFPRAGAALIVSNHPSALDGHLMMVVCPRRVYFLGAAQLFTPPLAGWYLRHLGVLPLQPGDNVSTMDRVGSLFRSQQLVMIMPEGFAHADPAVRQFHPGFFRIAGRFGVPLLPVAIAADRQALSPREARSRLRQPRVDVSVLAPIAVPDLHEDRAAFAAGVGAVQALVANEVARLHRLRAFGN